MRLPRDAELPDRLVALNRLQFAHGLLVVLAAAAIWLPAPVLARPWLPAIDHLVALYLVLQVGLYTGAELGRGGHSLLPAAVVLCLSVIVAALLPLLAATLLLMLAVLFLFFMERVAVIRADWPEAWLRGRRQHMQFQVVALASVLFWLFSRDNQLLVERALQS